MRRKKTMINRTGMEAQLSNYTSRLVGPRSFSNTNKFGNGSKGSRDLAHRGIWMVHGNNELQDLSGRRRRQPFRHGGRRCRRSLISPGVVVVPRHSSESQFTVTMFSRLGYCNRVLSQHLCVIPHANSSPHLTRTSTAQHHRQTHPNADADLNARKLPTNNINAFDKMGPVLKRTISRRKR
ncbi:hypothetical protein BGY98DRAFT_695682 [Russula aff. rugulosa BPL654]|nr:hypothetical protein BGY98DRAFT_695682 [Russula aff. rugulosa BPL654]